MKQNEIGRSGGNSSTLESPQEDNPSGGSRAGSSSESESKAPKQASGTILDPSGDPAERRAPWGRARELGRDAAERLDDLIGDTAQLIRDRPLGAAVSALGVGLVLGLVVGILVGDD